MCLKEFKGAIDDFTKAIEIDPNDDSSYKCRGLSKKILKDFKGALDDFNKAIEIGKEKGYQLMWLGVWELNHKALKFYEKKGLKAFHSHTFQLGNESQNDILMQLKF